MMFNLTATSVSLYTFCCKSFDTFVTSSVRCWLLCRTVRSKVTVSDPSRVFNKSLTFDQSLTLNLLAFDPSIIANAHRNAAQTRVS